MSRCFSYPPPGYILSQEKSEALIELVKLQKEREKKKEMKREKKERKREKKERRREKKEKMEREERSKEKKDKSSHLDAETELLEQSGLTEEHEHPVSSSSYDSTENSNKRKRQHSSPDECSHGKSTLIRLSSKGQSDFHTLAKGQQLPPTSTHGPENLGYTSGSSSSIDQDDKEEACWTSGKTGENSSLNSVMRGVESQYKHLLESCLPPLQHYVSLYLDDSDWLYPNGRNQHGRAEKRQRSGSDSTSCSSSSSWTPWPRAEYLHEIGAFALPYVVPY